MKAKLTDVICFYLFGLLVAIWLFSPFLAYYVADWSNPISYEKRLKTEQELKNDTSVGLNQGQEEFKCKIDTVIVKWEIDKVSTNQRPKFLVKKLVNLPWFPSTTVMMILYPFLLLAWLNFYIKTNLYFFSTTFSYITKILYVQGFVIIGCIIAGIIIANNTPLSIVVENKEIMKSIRDSRNFSNLYATYPLIMGWYLMVCFNCLILGVSEIYYKYIKKFVKKIFTNLYAWMSKPIVGVRVKIKKSGIVKVSKIEQKTWGIIPYFKFKNHSLVLSNFLIYLRKTLLSDISSKFLKSCKNEIFHQLRHRFLDMTYNANKFFEGGAIPKNLRFIVQRGNKKIIVIQEEPRVHSVNFAPLILEKEKSNLKKTKRLNCFSDEILELTSFDLAFPYCIFVVVIHDDILENLYAYWSPNKVNSLDDRIYQFGLPNIGDDGKVCLGQEVLTDLPLVELCESVIDNFWNGYFSAHLIKTFEKSKNNNRKIQSLYDWHKSSKNEDQFMLHLDMNYVRYEKSQYKWKSYYYLKDIVEDVLEKEKNQSSKIFDNFIDDILFNKPLSLELLEGEINSRLTPNQIFNLIEEGRKNEHSS